MIIAAPILIAVMAILVIAGIVAIVDAVRHAGVPRARINRAQRRRYASMRADLRAALGRGGRT